MIHFVIFLCVLLRVLGITNQKEVCRDIGGWFEGGNLALRTVNDLSERKKCGRELLGEES
jgi:hypothetical protein